jgi:hypothetical protein
MDRNIQQQFLNQIKYLEYGELELENLENRNWKIGVGEIGNIGIIGKKRNIFIESLFHFFLLLK